MTKIILHHLKNKLIMIKSILLLYIIILFYSGGSHSSLAIKTRSITKASECIIKNLGRDVNDSIYLFKDSIYIAFNNKLSSPYSKVFDVFNTTSKNIYLYSGLFNPDWFKQPYVHQYEKYKNEYVFSLTPLYKNFKNVFQYNAVLDAHYNWYRFIELRPNQFYRLRISIENTYFNKGNNAINLIDSQTAYEALNSPLLNLNEQIVQSAIIRIGIYKDINDLCETRMFTQDELTELQMNFSTISTYFSFWGR